MATFIAKNSGGVKKKPMIILEELIFFILVSTSGLSEKDWEIKSVASNKLIFRIFRLGQKTRNKFY